MIKKRLNQIFPAVLLVCFVVGSLKPISRRRGARPKKIKHSLFSPLSIPIFEQESAPRRRRTPKRAVDPIDVWMENYQNRDIMPNEKIQFGLTDREKMRLARGNRDLFDEIDLELEKKEPFFPLKTAQEIGAQFKTREWRFEQDIAEREQLARKNEASKNGKKAKEPLDLFIESHKNFSSQNNTAFEGEDHLSVLKPEIVGTVVEKKGNVANLLSDELSNKDQSHSNAAQEAFEPYFDYYLKIPNYTSF